MVLRSRSVSLTRPRFLLGALNAEIFTLIRQAFWFLDTDISPLSLSGRLQGPGTSDWTDQGLV